MVATMDVPGVGSVDKRWVWGGLAAAGGFVAFVWYRRRRSGGPVEYVADPATGSTGGSDVYQNPAPSYSQDADTSKLPPTTDQEWLSRVVEVLTWYEPGYLSSVLSKYIARLPLTTSEASLVRESWAWIGKPPGNQQIILTQTSSAPGDGPPAPEPEPAPTPAPTPTPAPAPTPAPRTYTVPAPMTVKDVGRAVYGEYVWNGSTGRLYWANEGVIVGAARAAGVWSDYADFKLPAGTVLVIP